MTKTETLQPKFSCCGNSTKGYFEKTKKHARGKVDCFKASADSFLQDVRCFPFNIYKAELTESLGKM